MATDVRGGGVAEIHKDGWKSSWVNLQLELRSFDLVCARHRPHHHRHHNHHHHCHRYHRRRRRRRRVASAGVEFNVA